MELLEKIFIHSKRSISDEEMQQIFQESDYELFHTQVEKLVVSGVLVPVKSSKTNGRLPPLFNKCRIIKPQEDYSGYLESVRRLNPLLNIAGYFKDRNCIESTWRSLKGSVGICGLPETY